VREALRTTIEYTVMGEDGTLTLDIKPQSLLGAQTAIAQSGGRGGGPPIAQNGHRGSVSQRGFESHRGVSPNIYPETTCGSLD